MKFCTQCGNQVEEKAKFCGKCGQEIGREETAQSAGVENGETKTSDFGNHKVSTQHPSKNKTKKNAKILGLLAVISLVILYFLISPKQLTEREYEDLAIKLMIEDEMALEAFAEAIDYSDVYIGYELEWTEEYRQLVKPAKALERSAAEIRKTLEGVKPPKYFEYEHENLLKAFNAHENGALHIRTYMEAGGEHHLDLIDEYQERGDELIGESIFASFEYEDRLMEAYDRMIRE